MSFVLVKGSAHGRLLLLAHALRLDLPTTHDGVDDHGDLLLHHTLVVALRRPLLRIGLLDVQIPIALRLHQRVSIGWLHVVCRVPLLDGLDAVCECESRGVFVAAAQRSAGM